jgi:hypothetical protein
MSAAGLGPIGRSILIKARDGRVAFSLDDLESLKVSMDLRRRGCLLASSGTKSRWTITSRGNGALRTGVLPDYDEMA